MKKIASERSVFDVCDQLEAESPGSWNRDMVISELGGGSAATVAPIIKAWRELQSWREETPEMPSHTVQSILVGVNELIQQHFKQTCDDLISKEQKLLDLTAEYEKAVRELNQAKAEAIGALQTDISEMEQSYDARIESLESELQDLKKTHALALNQLQGLQETTQAREKQLEDATAESNELRVKLKELKETTSRDIEDANNNLANEQAKTRRLEDRYEDLQHKHNEAMRSHANAMDELKLAHAEQAKSQEAYWREEIARCKAENEELRQRQQAMNETWMQRSQEQLSEFKKAIEEVNQLKTQLIEKARPKQRRQTKG